MHIVTINKKKYKLPSTWKDVLQFKQSKRVAFVKLIFVSDSKTEQLTEQLFLFIPKYKLAKIDSDTIYELAQILAWNLTEPMTMPMVKHYRGFYFPSDFMEHSVMIELALVDFYFQNIDFKTSILQTNTYNVVATLCRKRKSRWIIWLEKLELFGKTNTGDIRKKLDTNETRNALIDIMSWKVDYLLLVLNQYIGIRQQMVNTYGKLFPATIEKKKDEFEPEPMAELQKGTGFMKLIVDVAKENMYGTYEQTCQTYFHTVLMNLQNF